MNSENFYKVYGTINNLLYNRGYFRSDNASMSYDLFKDIPRSELIIKTKARPSEDLGVLKDDIIVFFPDTEKIGVKLIRQYKQEMIEDSLNKAIIIVKEGITPFARSNIQNEIKEPMTMEIFTESELIMDITLHSLVPKHELLNPKEKEELLRRYNIKESQMPKILHTDPISRYYGLKKRDILRITRLSETAGTYINYRIVV